MWDKAPLLVMVGGIAVLSAAFSITSLVAQNYRKLFEVHTDSTDFMLDMEFSDDKVISVLTGIHEKTTFACGYDAVEYAVEKDGYFTVSTKDRLLAAAYPDITEGTPDGLRSLLAEKLGDRFIKG